MKKKKNSVYYALVTILLIFLLIGCKKKESPLEVDISIGYDNSAKVASGNPVTFNVKNKGKELIGEIQVEINKSQQQTIVFAKEFQLAEGGEKEITMVVPIYTIQKVIKVKIVSEGKLIYDGTAKVDRFMSPVQPIIAVISDQPDNYRYFNSVQYNYFNNSDKINYYYQSVTETTEPEQSDPVVFYFDNFDKLSKFDNLEYFNYIFIGANTNLSITEDSEKKILDWVSKGNTLMLETGKDYKRLYSFIPESLTNFIVDKTIVISPEMLFTKIPLGIPLSLAVGNSLTIENTVSYEEDNHSLAQYTRLNQGQIINSLMDLSSKEFADWPHKALVMSNLIRRGINGSQSVFGQNSQVDNGYASNFMDMLNYIPIAKKPPYTLMSIILGIYIILVGPVLYIIFKRRDKRDYLWAAIPILAFMCIFTLYLFGFGTRYKKPLVNMISTIDYVDGNDFISVGSEIAVFNNKSGNMTVDWDRSEKIDLNGGNNDYYYGNTSQKRGITGKMTQGSRVSYEVYDTPLWSKSDFIASKIIPLSVEKDATFVTFDIEGNTVHVTLFNKTPFDLETAYLQWGGSYVYIGDIAGLESKEIDFSMDEMYLDFYTFRENLYSKFSLHDSESEMGSNISFYERLANYNYKGESGLGLKSIESVVIRGMNKSDIGYDLLVNNNEADKYNRNIISLNTTITFEKGAKLSIPENFLLPSCRIGMNEENMYERTIDSYIEGKKHISIFEEKIADFTYTLPEYLVIDTLKLTVHPLYLEQDFYEKSGFGGQIQPVGGSNYELYNVLSKEYDEVEALDEVFDLDITKYVDEENQVKIRVLVGTEYEGDAQYFSKILEVPSILIEGRAK